MSETAVPMAELFGVKIHSIRFAAAVTQLGRWMQERPAAVRYVITPNLNHIVMYQRNAEFRSAYESAALIVPDGRYTKVLGGWLGEPILETINGSDLVPALFSAHDGPRKLRVFLLGALPGVAERAAERIHESWPMVEVSGVYSPPFGFEQDPAETEEILRRVEEAAADLLVVGISPPKQEIWVATHRQRLRVGVAICAGATIDFLAGEKSRAPVWMQKSGLEWLHRMLTEPFRLAPRYFSDGWAVMGLLRKEFSSRLRARFSRES